MELKQSNSKKKRKEKKRKKKKIQGTNNYIYWVKAVDGG